MAQRRLLFSRNRFMILNCLMDSTFNFKPNVEVVVVSTTLKVRQNNTINSTPIVEVALAAFHN